MQTTGLWASWATKPMVERPEKLWCFTQKHSAVSARWCFSHSQNTHHTLHLIESIDFRFQSFAKVIYLLVQLLLVYRWEMKTRRVLVNSYVATTCVQKSVSILLSIKFFTFLNHVLRLWFGKFDEHVSEANLHFLCKGQQCLVSFQAHPEPVQYTTTDTWLKTPTCEVWTEIILFITEGDDECLSCHEGSLTWIWHFIVQCVQCLSVPVPLCVQVHDLKHQQTTLVLNITLEVMQQHQM